MLVVTEYVTPHANDKQEIEPALQALKELAEPLGPAEAILADTGYYSEANVRACQAAGVTPYIAMGRESPSSTGGTTLDRTFASAARQGPG